MPRGSDLHAGQRCDVTGDYAITSRHLLVSVLAHNPCSWGQCLTMNASVNIEINSTSGQLAKLTQKRVFEKRIT